MKNILEAIRNGAGAKAEVNSLRERIMADLGGEQRNLTVAVPSAQSPVGLKETLILMTLSPQYAAAITTTEERAQMSCIMRNSVARWNELVKHSKPSKRFAEAFRDYVARNQT